MSNRRKYWTWLFENVTHRRQRAFKRVAKAVEDREIRPATAERYISPLALCTLLDPKGEKQTQLLTTALDKVSAIANCMSWSNFRRLLDLQLTLALRSGKEKESSKTSQKRSAEIERKMAIKIVCQFTGRSSPSTNIFEKLSINLFKRAGLFSDWYTTTPFIEISKMDCSLAFSLCLLSHSPMARVKLETAISI
mgnify:CR=1 FL=1